MADPYRAPIAARASALARSPDEPKTHDLFAAEARQNEVPHPDFQARLAIWRDQKAGAISLAEASRRSAAIGAPLVGSTRLATSSPKLPGAPRAAKVARPRHTRPQPNDSRQYAAPMATTAARDDRLTPNAKAFLQVLRARCGKGRETTITKGTAANIMARSTRTIRRYLEDLIRHGYIETQIRTNRNGMHLGLLVTLTDLAFPFYETARGLARWLAETPGALLRSFESVVSRVQGVTLLSPKNQTQTSSLQAGADTSRFAGRDRLLRKRRWRIPTVQKLIGPSR
ncbi:hypothetical protein GCM10011390_49720 [Aureimonas endophytica]|uniref:Uncharacterized protein n=1 Tax=Aureimonas endophytica TaxID=2027858 RepID=A0A917EEL0_9HYPH|nr:helix-turn-helix domain-containing protein [Aureimonas endophytica]GGE24362.1 hypothetical protein GCM10011390_49720 [Aureimonas endophytica]